MSADRGQPVDTNSTEFKQGVDAGLSSTEDTENWQAGNELGQELKDESQNKVPVTESLLARIIDSAFYKSWLRGSENAQDEKDETVE